MSNDLRENSPEKRALCSKYEKIKRFDWKIWLDAKNLVHALDLNHRIIRKECENKKGSDIRYDDSMRNFIRNGPVKGLVCAIFTIFPRRFSVRVIKRVEQRATLKGRSGSQGVFRHCQCFRNINANKQDYEWSELRVRTVRRL